MNSRPSSDQDRIGLDVNIVIAGPGTHRETAVDDAVMTARFALMSGAEHGVKVDLNLHPYYPGSRGSARFPDHPRCSLATTVRAVTQDRRPWFDRWRLTRRSSLVGTTRATTASVSSDRELDCGLRRL